MSRFARAEVERALALVRAACLPLPAVTERLSHGGPAFFIKDKSCFVMFLDDHHDDGRLAIWCAAPEGVQAELKATTGGAADFEAAFVAFLHEQGH